jgi:biopolymer transport protein TolR
MPGIQPADANGSGRGRRRRAGSTLSEINVVPLVDVMLVLLIIFMVTAPMIQRGVDVNLPVAKQANTIEGERFFITVPASYAQDRRVYLGEEAIRVDVLSERVRQRFETSNDKQVYLRGDGAVLYRDIVDVFDRLKQAGVERVGIVTDPPKRQR